MNVRSELYIDGIDIFDQFGAVIIDGGCNDFFSLPSIKQPEATD